MQKTLSSQSLEAFVMIAKFKSFSKAASALLLTQPALSKRIMLLEQELEVRLFIRSRSGVQLTDAGVELLNYCRMKDSIERELIERLTSSDVHSLAGRIRVAGPSSLIFPIVFPALEELVRDHPKVDVEFYVREIVDLLPMLVRNEVDYILGDLKYMRRDLHTVILGEETLLAIESSQFQSRKEVYLDAHPSDRFTEEFFMATEDEVPLLRRNYLPDEKGIIEGVERGMGRAIVHQHMIPPRSQVKKIAGIAELKKEAYLHYSIQPFYSQLHQKVVDLLLSTSKKVLQGET